MSDQWIFASLPEHLRAVAEREFRTFTEEEREAVRYALARELPEDTAADVAAAVLEHSGHGPDEARQIAERLAAEPTDFRRSMN